MTLYTPVWPDVPRAQYDALPVAARRAFVEKFEMVLNDPYGVGDYDIAVRLRFNPIREEERSLDGGAPVTRSGHGMCKAAGEKQG